MEGTTMTPAAANEARAEPTITFYRAIPASFEPMRADRAALGVIPHAAVQYCEAITRRRRSAITCSHP
jgi:hypothetical protein